MSNTNNLSEGIVQFVGAYGELNFVNCQKLADKNDPEGIYWLGYCYEFGIECEKDERKAFKYYQKSADMCFAKGMYQVGQFYYLGIGIEMDKCKAFEYFLKSAEAGYSMGIFKTAICYKYGIGVAMNLNKYCDWIQEDKNVLRFYRFDDDFRYGLRLVFDYCRSSKYEKCTHCNEYNTDKAWCQACDPDITIQGWTSGNKDEYMKEFQLRTYVYEDMIEWIPFNRLNNIEVIGRGGFGFVYSAIWLDGIRKIKENSNYRDNYLYSRSRKPSIIALKTLSGSFKEFINHANCKLWGSKLELYGLTQNTETNEYMVVFQYANNGSLNELLRTKNQNFDWKIKLKILEDISSDLNQIHKAGYIHADIHSGNILIQNENIFTIKSYITDLGLSRSHNQNDSGEIYGVLPYIAPEVLMGQRFTKAADIYGFGVIMSEMSTGQRPFDEADKIIKELPIVSPKHQNHMYTSKSINTREIKRLFEITDSKQIYLNLDSL